MSRLLDAASRVETQDTDPSSARGLGCVQSWPVPDPERLASGSDFGASLLSARAWVAVHRCEVGMTLVPVVGLSVQFAEVSKRAHLTCETGGYPVSL